MTPRPPLFGRAPVWFGSIVWPKLTRARRATGKRRVLQLGFSLTGLAIAVGIYAASVWLLRLCAGVEIVGPLLLRRLLDIVLLVLMSVLLMSNLVTALSTFFLAKDLDLLVSAPLPPRSLYGARFAEQLLQSSWMVFAFGSPVLIAFATVAGSPLTVVALAFCVPALLVIPAAIATAIALLLVSSLPAARLRDLVIAIGLITFIALYLMLRLVQPEQFLNPDGFASMVTFLSSFSRPSGPWLPSHWATIVISATFRDDTGSGNPLLMLGLLLTFTASLHATSGALFRRFYRLAYTRTQHGRKVAKLSRIAAQIGGARLAKDGPIRAPGRHGAKSDGIRAIGSVLRAGPLREFFIKDLKLLLRDASQWSQLLLLGALMLVYLYNFKHFRQLGDTGLIGRLGLFFVGLVMTAFVTTAVSVRFAFPLLSLEGKMLWLLNTAPIKPAQIIRAKLLSAAPPLLVVAEIMSIASSLILGLSPGLLALGAVVAGTTALCVAALSTGMGALLPEYDAESAAKIATSFGALVCMSLSIGVAIGLVGSAIYPALVLHYQHSFSWAGLVASVLAFVGIGVISFVVPLRAAANVLAKRNS